MSRQKKKPEFNPLYFGEQTFWKVGIYCRLSRDDGNDVSNSIRNQVGMGKRYLELSFPDPHELVDIYDKDDGVTGTTDNREDFQRLLGDIETGRINCVIIKNLSRLTRNIEHQTKYLEQLFLRRGCRVVIYEDQIDTFVNPQSARSVETRMKGVFNEHYAQATSQSVRNTFDFKRDMGVCISAFAPYGYLKDENSRFIVDEEAAAVIQDIFNWYAGGMTKVAIAKKLNDLGVPTPIERKRALGSRHENNKCKGKPLWYDATVHRILHNEVYAGHLIQGKQTRIDYLSRERVPVPRERWFVTRNAHEPIITQAQFDRVQDLLKLNTRAISTGAVSLFSGLVECGVCGYSMRVKYKSRGGTKSYQCRRGKGEEPLHSTSIRDEVLRGVVLDAIQREIALIPDLRAVLDGFAKEQREKSGASRFHARLQKKNAELIRVQNTIDQLFLAKCNGELTGAEYARNKVSLASRESVLAEEINNLEQARDKEACQLEGDPELLGQLLDAQGIASLDNAMCRFFLEKIIVYTPRHIKIQMKFQSQENQPLFMESSIPE